MSLFIEILLGLLFGLVIGSFLGLKAWEWYKKLTEDKDEE